jgi:hypothetical protein
VFKDGLCKEKSFPGIEWEPSMESSRSCPKKRLIFKAGTDFVFGSSLPPSRESIPQQN